METDALQPHAGGIPIMRVALHLEVPVVAPFHETERAVAHERTGVGPTSGAVVGARAVAFHRRRVDGEADVGAQHGGEIRGGLLERDDQRVVVRRGEAGPGEVGDAPLGERLRVAHRVEGVAVLRGEPGRQRAAEAEQEVTRRERVAVGPFSVAAQMEGVREAVGRHLPAFRRARTRLQGLLVQGEKTLEEGAQDVVVDTAAREMGVEGLDLRAVADEEHARPAAGCGRRVRTFAARGEQQSTGGEQRAGEEGCVSREARGRHRVRRRPG